MNKKKTFMFLILTLFIILGLSTVSATDVTNETVANDISIDNQIDTVDNQVTDNVGINKNIETKTKLRDDGENPVITVDETQTVTDYESLKTAWNNVVTNGDDKTDYVINLKNGEYKFDETLSIDTTSNIVSLTLNGEDNTQTILDGQNNVRLLNLNKTGITVTLNNLTLANANSNMPGGVGGAIYSICNLNLYDDIFSNNMAHTGTAYTNGGVIYHSTGLTTVVNCIFKDNYGVAGGVFYGTNTGLLNVTKSTFINNTGSRGGVFSEGSTGKVNITYCDFINNTGTMGSVLYHGWLYQASDYHMNYCIFDGNQPVAVVSGQTQQGNADYTCNYYADGSQPNGFTIVVNKKLPVAAFNQNTKNLTISLNKDDAYGFITVTGIGVNGTSFEVTSSSDLINTDGITLTNDNNYTATLDLSNLPENYENISVFVDENEVAVITWDYTNIELNNITTNIGKTVNITAKVSTSKNVGINTGYVVFKINGKTIGLANVSLGKATLSYTIPDNYSSKNYTITADYKKNSKFQGAMTNATLNIEKINTKGTLSIEAVAGQNATMTYDVVDADGNKATKGTVVFKVNGVTVARSNITDGTAEGTYLIPTKYAGKKINVTAVLGTNNKYTENTATLQKALSKLNTTSTITASNLSPNKTATITVNVLDQNNNKVTNGKVAIKVNGITIATSNIKNGVATANYTIPAKWANKQVTFTSTYGETANYLPSKGEKTETVQKVTTTKLSQDKLRESSDATLYVSNDNGADTNDGTQTNPLKTIEKAISIVNTTKTPTTIYLEGTFKGLQNTNLTVPGDLTIDFIGLNDAKIDGEVNYTIKTELDPDEYYWGSSPVWYPYNNGKGNWAMTITAGTGKISITNLTIQNCWAPGGSDISAYQHATIDNYGNLDVNNVTFFFNHGGVGGAIRNNNGGTLYVENSMFDSNRKSSSTGNYGPGIYNNGTATIINSTFQNNYARWGTVTNDKVMSIINSTIQNNIGYDGGSTYKTGSGITINTAGTNFGTTINNTGISTIIDGCTFYNNDQLDLYADVGELTLNNSIFNESSGMVVPANSNGNRQINCIITNNIFTSLTGSTLYYSLGSSNKAIFAMKLQGTASYTIDNNIVTNITGVDQAIYVSGYASITNNNFTRQLWLAGTYNTVQNNNITTTSEIYAINLTGTYSNITDNYLVGTAYTGNDAVAYTDKTNIIENNIPLQTSIRINDDNFDRYFTRKGELIETLKEITHIEVIGTLTNKDIILNTGNELNVIQTANFNSTNITITVTNNTKVTINGLKINNNNNQTVFNITTNDNTITKTTITTDNEYSIVLTGTDNSITENNLIANILVGDESVNAPEENIISSNTPTYKNILITNDNYNTYFDSEGKLITEAIPENSHLLFSGNFYNKKFIFVNGTNIIVNHDSVTLYNSTVIAENDAILNMSYISIENTDGQIAIDSSAKEIYLFYNNIITTSDAVIIKDATKIDVEYNNITATSTENITALTIDNGTATTSSYNNYQVLRNNINVTGPEVDPDYNSGLSGTTAALITNMPAIQFSYNNITVTSNGATGYYPTIYAVNAINGTLENFVTNCKTRLYDNVIYASGQNYIYGINVMNITSEAMYNEIHVDSQVYSAGIQATNTKAYGSDEWNTYGIAYHEIYSTSPNAYGIVLTQPYDLLVRSNEIYTTGNNSVGIDVYGGVKNNTIRQNEITADGNYTSGITLTSCEEINMTQNTIITKNDISEDSRIVDIISSNKVSLTSNTIKGYVKNTVVIDESSTDVSVRGNNLYATGLFGDESVLDLNGNNRVMDNTPNMDDPITYYFLDETTYDVFFDENGVLRDNIEEGTIIQQTGDLYNKILNITKPITLISTSTNLYNSTIILTGNNINLTNQSFINTNIESLIVNSNNNIVQGLKFEYYVTEDMNITFMTIKGKNNQISVDSSQNYYYIYSDNNVNANIIIQQLSGKNNTLNTGGLITSNAKNLTSVLIKDLVDGSHTSSYISPQNCENAYDIVIVNTTNSKIYANQPDNYNSINWTCILIENSTNNYVEARIMNQGPNTVGVILMIMNNSDSNYLNLSGAIQRGVTSIPYIITNSNNNTIAGGTFSVPNYDGYVMNVTNSYNNTIYFNTIQSQAYGGDSAILQDNEYNIVRDNLPGRDSTNPSNNVFLTVTPSATTVTVGDTITITANVTYRTSNAWNAPIYPVTSGTVLFDVNGEKTRVAVDENGIATVTYTVPFTSQESFKVVTEYEYNTEYGAKLMENTINVIKRDATLTILDDYHEYKAGETVTFRALVTEGDTLVKSGRVVFKLNGITLKDENGKAVYAKVSNGIAVLNYTLPSTFSAKTYNVTAAFSDSGYNRAENTSQLTVTKTNTHVESDIIKTSGETANLVAKIFDEDNNLIESTEKVTVKINGKTVQKAVSVTGGLINLTLDTPYKNNVYTVTIIVSTSSRINASRVNTALVIDK